MKIGILCAMASEFDQLKPYLTVKNEIHTAKTTLLEAEIDGLDIVLAASGIAMVNAGITAQMLIDRFGVTHILMAGVAGGMDNRLGLRALVFSERLAQHDVNSYFLRHRGGIADGYYPADPHMLSVCRRLNDEKAFAYPVFFGTMVSGEQFIDQEGRQQIVDAWHPLCVDMESAAAAYTCFVNDIPFLAIRAISDTESESGMSSFEKNQLSAADAAASAAAALLRALARGE